MRGARAGQSKYGVYIQESVGKILTGMVVLLRANNMPLFKHHMVRARSTGGPNVRPCRMHKTARFCDIHIEPVCSFVCARVAFRCMYCMSRSNSAKIELIYMLFCVAIKADARNNSAQIAFISQLFSALIPFCVYIERLYTWPIFKFII